MKWLRCLRFRLRVLPSLLHVSELNDASSLSFTLGPEEEQLFRLKCIFKALTKKRLGS